MLWRKAGWDPQITFHVVPPSQTPLGPSKAAGLQQTAPARALRERAHMQLESIPKPCSHPWREVTLSVCNNTVCAKKAETVFSGPQWPQGAEESCLESCIRPFPRPNPTPSDSHVEEPCVPKQNDMLVAKHSPLSAGYQRVVSQRANGSTEPAICTSHIQPSKRGHRQFVCLFWLLATSQDSSHWFQWESRASRGFPLLLHPGLSDVTGVCKVPTRAVITLET